MSPGQFVNVGRSRGSGENPRSDRQNLVRFFEIVLSAEQSNIRCGEAASTFRKRNVVMHVMISSKLHTPRQQES
jgi:hypothetical protein